MKIIEILDEISFQHGLKFMKENERVFELK